MKSDLKGLLELHDLDQQVSAKTAEMEESKSRLAELDDSVATLEDGIDTVASRLDDLRTEVRKGERALDEKRNTLSRIRNRVSRVQNERQYSAASMEADLVKRDLRRLEEQVLGKMQEVEDTEAKRKDLEGRLAEAREGAGNERQTLESRVAELEEELAILADKRGNLTVRLNKRSLSLYDRILSGRSEVAMAPVTDEGVCGYCHTFVPVQQQMEINNMNRLVTCEGCGVILYPSDLG